MCCSFAVCGSSFLPLRDPGRPLDVLGHHRAACANVGVLGRRGFALENAAARVCREASGRVSVDVAVRDLDIGVLERLEVVADGLPLFHGVQIAVDTTLVSVLRMDARKVGAALVQARVCRAARCEKGGGWRSRWEVVRGVPTVLVPVGHSEDSE